MEAFKFLPDKYLCYGDETGLLIPLMAVSGTRTSTGQVRDEDKNWTGYQGIEWTGQGPGHRLDRSGTRTIIGQVSRA